MRTRCLSMTAVVLIALVAAPQPRAAQETPELLGFSPWAAAEQYELESRYDARLDADSLRSWMRTLTAEPFWTGSPYNREMAEWTADRFREWGFDVEIEEFRVLYPLPRIRELELLSTPPHKYDDVLLGTQTC